MSLRTVTTMMVSGMHSVWMRHVAREQWDMASAFAMQLCARWLSSGPADSQPVASDTRNHMMLLCVCKCMLLCECMCTSLARLACVQRACRACCARVCSCARRRAASVGEACEAKAGQARCAHRENRENRENDKFGIGRSGESRRARTAFFVRAWCPCDATAAECQLLRLWSTLSADCLYNRHAHHCYLRSASSRGEPPTNLPSCVVGVESGTNSGLGLL